MDGFALGTLDNWIDSDFCASADSSATFAVMQAFPASADELFDGAVFVIDKPLDWTSFDVVNRIKGWVARNIQTPVKEGNKLRFKIGHAGTLDPLATGVLVICTGKMTKRITEFQGGEKTYTGTITFGQTTPSYDLETTPVGTFRTDHLSLRSIQEAAGNLTGDLEQVPPVFSAKWIDGKRAYESAREGLAVEMKPARVQVYDFDITEFKDLTASFRIRCSKGTYIRSLAHELGLQSGSGSYLSSLRRTGSFPFSDKDSVSLDDLFARLSGITGYKDRQPPVN